MKTITKVVNIQNREFVLIQLEEKDIKWEKGKMLIGKYGTIDYDLLDEKGCLKHRISGLDMCLSNTISEAIDSRNDEINCEKFIDLDDEARMKAIINYYTNKQSLQGAR